MRQIPELAGIGGDHRRTGRHSQRLEQFAVVGPDELVHVDPNGCPVGCRYRSPAATAAGLSCQLVDDSFGVVVAMFDEVFGDNLGLVDLGHDQPLGAEEFNDFKGRQCREPR